MRAFITGGTGFVGSGVIDELLRGGHAVTALVRTTEAAQRLPAGVEPKLGNLDDLDVIRAAAAESDAVVHCAFDHNFRFMDIVGVVLVKLTRVASLARVAPVARMELRAIDAILEGLASSPSASAKVFVCTSPIALLPGKVVGTENDAASTGSFGCFRVASERAVLAAGARGVRSAVIRLPPSVHGPNDHGFVPTLMDIARRSGVSAFLGKGENRWPAVHRADAATLYRIAMEQLASGKIPGGSVLHAVADEGVPFVELAQAIADRLGLGSAAPRKSSHFGNFAMFAAIDNPATSKITRELTGWKPEHPGLLDDVRGLAYATATGSRKGDIWEGRPAASPQG
jgi:nucleoside-diphosphate-sugar epimerase